MPLVFAHSARVVSPARTTRDPLQGETLKDDEGHKAARARRLARLTSEDSHRRTAASATASDFASESVPAAHALAGQERPSEATALHEPARPALEITTPPETVTRPASA